MMAIDLRVCGENSWCGLSRGLSGDTSAYAERTQSLRALGQIDLRVCGESVRCRFLKCCDRPRMRREQLKAGFMRREPPLYGKQRQAVLRSTSAYAERTSARPRRMRREPSFEGRTVSSTILSRSTSAYAERTQMRRERVQRPPRSSKKPL